MKVVYILKKLKTFQYKEFFKKAKQISKKIKRPSIFVLYDMIKCAFHYGSGYMDYFEFEFYLLNDKERSTYLTGEYNNRIVKKYNKKEDWYKLDDKVEFNKLFKKFLGREYIDLRHTAYPEFKKFVLKKKKIVIKPIDDCGGKGVIVFDIKDINTKNDEDLLKLYNIIMKNGQFLVEEYLTQHKDLSKLYKDSLNSLRVITFLDDNNKVHILTTVLRIGNNGHVDNFSSGGMYTFVNDNGEVFVPAIDEAGNIYETHPISHTPIVGFKIPNYDKVRDFIETIARIVPTIRYVGWDLAITDNAIAVIEGNQYPGVFQVKPSISGIKTGDLGKYRKYMDI